MRAREIANSIDVRRFTVSSVDAGRRLDLYLASRLPELSRTRIQELIDRGQVRVGERLSRSAHRIAAGEAIEVEVQPRPPLAAAPEEIPIEVLYEDDDLVVVNKPAGMVVHAGAGARSGTLVNALAASSRRASGALSQAGGALRPGIVHRLDRGTSGALVVARNDAAHRALADQFRARTVHKTYIALAARPPGARRRQHRAADRPRPAPAHAHDRAAAHGARSAHRLARAAAPGKLHAGRGRAAHRPHASDSRALRGHRPPAWWATRSTARRSERAPAASCFRRSAASSCTRLASVSRTREAASPSRFARRWIARSATTWRNWPRRSSSPPPQVDAALRGYL